MSEYLPQARIERILVEEGEDFGLGHNDVVLDAQPIARGARDPQKYALRILRRQGY